MPIDLVIDDREGGSKSDSEDITRAANLTDQVRTRFSISASLGWGGDLHAYCLLDHYHLLLLFAYD